MATTADIKNGLCINHNNDIYQVIEFLHVKPGKGPAFVRTRIKSVRNGRSLEHTFPSGHTIEVVRVETRNFQFLYKDGTTHHFMDSDSYEQISVEEEQINAPQFLKEGQECIIQIKADDETILTVELPQYVVLKVTYAEPGFKGNSSSGNVTKPATLETGADVRVPLFIETDETIKIDTRTGDYIERVKD
jgi:elongation factor P